MNARESLELAERQHAGYSCPEGLHRLERCYTVPPAQGVNPDYSGASEPGSAPNTTKKADDLARQETEALAYRVARRRLRSLHTSLAGRRSDWANSDLPGSAARAVAYQSAMASVHSILDEIEAVAKGVR